MQNHLKMAKKGQMNSGEELRRLAEENRQCRARKEVARRHIEETVRKLAELERRRFVRGHLFIC